LPATHFTRLLLLVVRMQLPLPWTLLLLLPPGALRLFRAAVLLLLLLLLLSWCVKQALPRRPLLRCWAT
jgi:hypothetical protein